MSRSQLSPEEIERRLPSLRWISDNELREETRRLAQRAPDYFWTRPGSVKGYHNAHEHGLWKHTLKLSTVIDRLADSWQEQGHIDAAGVDCAHAAAILHDMRKEGASGGQTAGDHDRQMATVIRDASTLDERVAEAVEAHMGPWYHGPSPTPGTVEDLVHTADMVASAQAVDVHLPPPVPEELQPYAAGAVSRE